MGTSLLVMRLYLVPMHGSDILQTTSIKIPSIAIHIENRVVHSLHCTLADGTGKVPAPVIATSDYTNLVAGILHLIVFGKYPKIYDSSFTLRAESLFILSFFQGASLYVVRAAETRFGRVGRQYSLLKSLKRDVMVHQRHCLLFSGRHGEKHRTT